MSGDLGFAAYKTILFLDSMVALEAKPLGGLPWDEIDPEGPILLMVVPQVNKEVDKRKRDGRLGKRAREFNRLIAPAAESGSPVRLSDGPPRVDIAIAVTNRIDWDALHDLDPDDGDSRVVAQILNARGVPAERRLLFSHDINPIAMAARHGLKSKKMTDQWLLEPEPSPNEKEIFRLKARIGELEAKEPDIQFDVAFELDAPIMFHKISALMPDEQTRLVARILDENPRIAQQSSLYDPMGFDASYKRKYDHYSSKTVPRCAARLHRWLETHYNQIPFSLKIVNRGHVQAENLVISVRAEGGVLNDRFACYTIYGPTAPKPEPYSFASLRSRDWMPNIRDSAGRHDMEFAVGPERGARMEIHCQDFRQGREWTFNGVVEIDPYAESPLKLKLSVTASNQRGAQAKEFTMPFESKEVTAADLFDLDKRGLRVAIPMSERFDAAIERGDAAFFQFLEKESDDDDEDDEEQDGKE